MPGNNTHLKISYYPQPQSTYWGVIILFIGLIAFSQSAQAREQPVWELGAGLTSLHLPYYRGSRSSKTYTLPFPYLIYRGEFINVDEDGLRGWLFKSDDLRLDLSMALGVPVPSDQNGARVGMPSLATTIEAGPSLESRLWQSKKQSASLWLNLPLRTAFSIDGTRATHQGWTFSPYLEYSRASDSTYPWEGSVSIGPIFTDNAYHDYYYGVAPEYATLERPAYQAPGGYSGSRITMIIRKQFKDLWVTAFARLDSLNNARFAASPLVESNDYRMAGIAVTWIFARSTQRVSVSQ